MTKRDVTTLITQAADTRRCVEAQLAMRAFLDAHPGEILGAGELLHTMVDALKNAGTWDFALERQLRDEAGVAKVA